MTTDAGHQPSKLEVRPGERLVFVLRNCGARYCGFETDELHIFSLEIVVQ